MKAHFTLTLALLLLCTGAAVAQTPDPCGDETGAAYGLCNAYVAVECHTDTPSGSDVACSRIANKFLQITGRDLASKFVTCPCASVEGDFARVLAGEIPIQSCEQSENGIATFSDDPEDFDAFSANFNGQWFCGIVDGEEQALTISPEQGQYCAQLLEQEANSQGVTCTTP